MKTRYASLGYRPLHLDAILGSSEARNKPHKWYGVVSPGTADNVMRQEHFLGTWLCQEIGSCDA